MGKPIFSHIPLNLPLSLHLGCFMTFNWYYELQSIHSSQKKKSNLIFCGLRRRGLFNLCFLFFHPFPRFGYVLLLMNRSADLEDTVLCSSRPLHAKIQDKGPKSGTFFKIVLFYT